MQIAELNKKQTTRLFYSLVTLTLAVLLLTSEQEDPGALAAGIFLAVVSLYPLYFWLLGWSNGLPIWPIFCLVTGVTAALPIAQAPAPLSIYSPAEIIIGGMTIAGFIILGTIIWLSMTSQPPRPPRNLLMIQAEHANTYLFAFVAAGLFFQLNQNLRFIELPGNTMQIVRGISMSLNTMGLFVLSFYQGRGQLSKRAAFWLIALGVMTALGAAAGMLLASLMVPVAMMLFGYMLGSGRIPWLGFAAALAGLALLHPGKFTMRDKVWGEGRTPSLLGLPAFYAEWVGYSLEEVGSVTGLFRARSQEGEKSTVFERGGNVHMLLLVQKASPGQVPFQNGLTYQHIPRMLIPRFIDDQKGSSHTGNIILSVNYGLLEQEAVTTVSIGWGLIPEAYANFGYTGVVLLAIALAVFYSLAARATVGVPMTSLRFVLGLLFMSAATQGDTMGIFVTMQFQGVVGVTLAALVLMKRQRNPFAAEGGETERGAWSMERGAGKWGTRRQGAWSGEHGARQESARVGKLEGGKVGEGGRDTASAGPRDVGTGGTVRNMPIKMPKRVASWMPRRVRAAVVAQYAAEEEQRESVSVEQKDGNSVGQTEQQNRPRQLAVLYQSYRRYRG